MDLESRFTEHGIHLSQDKLINKYSVSRYKTAQILHT